MGANLCSCLRGGDQENYRGRERGRGRGSVKKSIRRMHYSFPPPPPPPPLPPRHENSCKVSLKDLIAASPSNVEHCKGVTISYGVDNENDERESGVVGMKKRERVLKKRVSFRSPQVADILVVSPVIYL